eukprot:CAMPEP_0184653100 /NCGR_PEP_ID=MMETSP0308-20130426/10833_1 /TAXON_ID=38269 /ORGANISM="Gloeochaete witrockiana, Strain SAG 46.84" /LENGTH=126 /DNA_ID=CAMNT_0027088397 /DNA_START=1419 /DNA_END=1799 /DNA_ORIENTATION=-
MIEPRDLDSPVVKCALIVSIGYVANVPAPFATAPAIISDTFPDEADGNDRSPDRLCIFTLDPLATFDDKEELLHVGAETLGTGAALTLATKVVGRGCTAIGESCRLHDGQAIENYNGLSQCEINKK